MPAGFQSAFDKPLPPYIEFKKEPVERRDADGNSFYVDINMAYITPPGGKDTMVKIADEWFPYIQRKAKDGQYPMLWYTEFSSQYEAWKKGEEAPVSGTHVKNWPAASPAEIKMLLDLRIATVEQVAAMNEEAVNRIGMGGRSLKQKAIDYLSAQTDIAPVVAKIDALTRKLEMLQLELAKKDSRIATLENIVRHREPEATPALLRPLEERLAEAQTRTDRTLPKDDAIVSEAINEVLE